MRYRPSPKGCVKSGLFYMYMAYTTKRVKLTASR
nr:MAG TPA: hypothetical protein [Caudoviricetes sp.]